MDDIEKILTEIINEQGIDYLQRDPYGVYQKLVEIDSPYTILVLSTLLIGAASKAQELYEEDLSKFFQKLCFLRKKPADEMSAMYKRLFSEENLTAWKEKENSGFAEFCKRTWTFKWKGSETWYSGGVHTDCDASVTAGIAVEDEDAAFEQVAHTLSGNPFTSAEEIFDCFAYDMEVVLNNEFTDYVTSDGYYPPVMEDFHHNAKYELEAICKKLGLKIVSFECYGDMSDFEQNRMRW